MSTDVLQGPTELSFELSEEQQLIRDSIRDFVERHVKPGVKERDASKEFPHDLVKKLAEQGFMGIHETKNN